MMKKLHAKILLVTLFFLPSMTFSQILFTENFPTGTLPAGWTNDSLGYPALHLWDFNNPYGRNISGAGFDANFAIFDSDAGGVDDTFDEDASLTTPSINISAASYSLFLDFDEQFRAVTGLGGATRLIKVSNDGGANWTTVDSTDNDFGYPNPAVHTTYDITSVLPASTLLVKFQYLGSWDWWWAIDNVVVTSRQLCTGAPNAGNTVAAINPVCDFDTFLVSLSGADVSIDLSYQWQSSPDGFIWNDLTDDTLETAHVVQTAATYYRCGLTCSGQTSYSAPLLVNMNAPTSCYCVGIFNVDCDAIDKVIFNTLSNEGSDCNGLPNNYINYPDTGSATTTVFAGSTYDLTFASGNGFGTHGAAVWFDFNHNGSFQDPGEYFFISDTIEEFSPDFITSITIPSNAVGATRMRVRYIYDVLITQADDCAPYDYGETEDYTITVFNPSIGLAEYSEKDIKIYPTPASGAFTVSMNGNPGKIEYLLFDPLGRNVIRRTGAGTTEKFDTDQLGNGIYLLRIETPGGSISRKVVIQK